MAGFNPFKEFRKNRKVALAALGVMAMISFIVLPIALQLMGGGQSRGPSVIATSRKYGSINELTLENLRLGRAALSRFYRQLAGKLAGPSEDQNAFPVLRMLAGAEIPSSEALIQRWLIANHAKDQEMVVSESMVTDYLRLITEEKLTNKLLEETLRDTGISSRQLQALLEEEILVNQMNTMFRIEISSTPPSLRWGWFQRMNRQVGVEVAAVAVEPFTKAVAEPSEKVLRNFFEENKYREFDPDSPASGFYIPRKMMLQYFVAAQTPAMLDAVTQEEIGTYYEANKNTMFRRQRQPLNVPGTPNPSGQNLLSPGFGTGMVPMPTLPTLPGGTLRFPAPSISPEATRSVEEQPADDAQPVEEPPADDAQPVDEQPADDAQPVDEQPAEGVDISSLSRRAVYHTVVFQEPQQEPSEDSSSTEEAAVDQTPAGQAPVETDGATDGDADSGAAPASPPSSDETSGNTPIDLSILYRPLDEVEGEIRSYLVQERLDKSLKEVETKMREYYDAFNKAFGTSSTVPPPPDMEAIAKEYGFELVSTTAPITLYEARDLSMGRDAGGAFDEIFALGAQQYEPKRVYGQEAQYLIWCTEEQKERLPAFEDVRETVLDRWKEVQARKLAVAHAEALATKARGNKEPFATSLAGESDLKFAETEPFTWKTYGSPYLAMMAMYEGRSPWLGEVREKGVAEEKASYENKVIFAPGDNFMKTAYELEIGEVGVSFNQPETVVYIIRPISSTPSGEVLRDLFRTTAFDRYAGAGVQDMFIDARQVWLKRIEDEAGFEWVQRIGERESE